MNERESALSGITRRCPYLPVVIVILTGLLLTLVAWTVTKDLVREKIRVDFEKKVEDRYEILRGAIESELHVIESLRAFYLTSQTVDRWTFGSFARHLLSYHQDIQALAWVTRVAHSRRESYETAVRQEGFPEFQITERKEQGKMIRAGEREEYFPAHFVEPLHGNDMAFGFDEASNQTRKETMERSRDTGEKIISPKLKLVQESVAQAGLLIFSPLYKKGAPTDSVQARRESLEGYILVVFRIRDLVEKTLGTLNPEGITMDILDLSASEERRLIYHHDVRSSAATAADSEKLDEETGLECTRPLGFAGREWLIMCRATPDFLTARIAWEHWEVLFIGLLLTALPASYTLFNFYRTQRVEELVKERTKELEEANRHLTVVEEELSAARERLQHLISSSPGVIFSCKASDDYATTFVSANVSSLMGYEPRDFTRSSSFWADHVHPDDLPQMLINRPLLFELGHHAQEYRFLCGDGLYRWMRDEVILVCDTNGEPREIVGCTMNIDERKKAEELVLASLKEKEMLLREIHHRVKNNLQVISSLLSLQLKYLRDEPAIRAFQETQNRIEAMALVHEKLYRSKNLARVDFAGYVHDLLVNMFYLYGVDSGRIGHQTDIADVSLNIDTAVPLGLLVNELVSNCLKHAFPALPEPTETCRKPMVRIDLHPADGGKFVLHVSDNGVGFSRSIDYRSTESLGLKLVMGLAEQLDGTIELDNCEGARFTLTFAELRYKARG